MDFDFKENLEEAPKFLRPKGSILPLNIFIVIVSYNLLLGISFNKSEDFLTNLLPRLPLIGINLLLFIVLQIVCNQLFRNEAEYVERVKRLCERLKVDLPSWKRCGEAITYNPEIWQYDLERELIRLWKEVHLARERNKSDKEVYSEAGELYDDAKPFLPPNRQDGFEYYSTEGAKLARDERK